MNIKEDIQIAKDEIGVQSIYKDSLKPYQSIEVLFVIVADESI